MRLQLQTREEASPASRDPPVVGTGSAPVGHVILDRKVEFARRSAKGIRHSSPVLGWLIFILLTAVVIGAQFVYMRMEEYRDAYRVFRLVYLGLACLMVLYDAFRDSMARGLMCMFIPFYIFFYAITRVDSYWRQGVFVSSVVMLGMEMVFLPKEALLTLAEVQVNAFIRNVAGMIERAGDAPMP